MLVDWRRIETCRGDLLQTQMAPREQFGSTVQAWSSREVVCVVLTLKWTNGNVHYGHGV